MVQCGNKWPDGIYACVRFSVLAVVICCVPGRLWTFTKRRMLWTLWQKTEFITLSQSHQKMPGIRGSFVRFVHSVQVWPSCSWESLGNTITSLSLEKRAFVPECHFLHTGRYHTYCGDSLLQLWRWWFSLSVSHRTVTFFCGCEHAEFKGYFRRQTKP